MKKHQKEVESQTTPVLLLDLITLHEHRIANDASVTVAFNHTT